MPRELDIAEASVKQQMHNLFRALGVSSRVEALAHWRRCVSNWGRRSLDCAPE